MKTLVVRFIEMLCIALLLTSGIAMVTAAFILRVVLSSEYPRRPVEGVIIGIAMVMLALQMMVNRIRSS